MNYSHRSHSGFHRQMRLKLFLYAAAMTRSWRNLYFKFMRDPDHVYFSVSTIEYKYVLHFPGKDVWKCESGSTAVRPKRHKGFPKASRRLTQWPGYPSVPAKAPPFRRAVSPLPCMPPYAAKLIFCSPPSQSKTPFTNYSFPAMLLSDRPPASPAKAPDSQHAAFPLQLPRSSPGRFPSIPAAMPRLRRSAAYR